MRVRSSALTWSLSAVLCWLGGCAQETAQLQPVALPAMEQIHPAIASQLRRWHAALPTDDYRSNPAPQDGAYGEFGQRLAAYGFLEAAASAFLNAAALDPSDGRWPHYQGIVSFESGNLEAAASYFRRSTHSSPEDSWRWLHLGSVLLELDQLAAAEVALRRALLLAPEDAAAHERLGRLASRHEDSAEAVRRFTRTLELQPEASAVHYALGRALLHQGQEQLARQHLKRRGEREVRWADPLLAELGDLIHRTVFEVIAAQISEPQARFDAAATLDFALDHLAGVNGAGAKIADWLEREKSYLGDTFRGRLQLVVGALQAAQGNDTQALVHLEQAVQLQPELVAARLRLARLLVRAGHSEAAFEHYTHLIQSDPEQREARLQRATLWVWARRFDEALFDLEYASSRRPKDAEIVVRLAATHRLAGDRRGYLRERRRLDDLRLDATARRNWYLALASSLEAGGWLEDAAEVRHAATPLTASAP